MSAPTRAWTAVALVAAVTLLVVSVAWTLNGWTMANSDHGWPGFDQAATGQRGAASEFEFEGSLVDVVAMDMAGHGMMNRSGGWIDGTMRLRSLRVDVPAGTVTLQFYNVGAVPHEIACNIENHYAADMYTLLVVT